MADWVDANRPVTLDSIEGVPDNHVITIRERRISVDFPTLIQNNVKTDTVTLDLDSEWDGINPVIIFTSQGFSTSVIYNGEPVFIPSKTMLMVGNVDVSVMGYDSAGEVRLVTVDAPGMFNVVKSGAYDGTTAEEASPDLLGQLVDAATNATSAANAANAAAESATSATTAATDATNKATMATEAANTATAAATNSAGKASTAATQADTARENAETATKNANAAVKAAETAIAALQGNVLHREVGPESVLRVEDSYPAKPIKMAIQGKTVQNLWVNPSGTGNGATVTSNNDGSVTLSGQCLNDNTLIEVHSYAFKPGATYVVSVDKLYDVILGWFFYSSNGTGVYIGGSGQGSSLSRTYTIPEDTEYIRMGVHINKTEESISGTFHIMLNEGETAEPWCPPGIHSVGEILGSKQNMIESFGGSSNGITATENADGTLSLAGEPETNAMFQIGTVSPLESGKQYTISIDTPIAHEYVSGSSGACLYLNVPSSDGGYGTDHIFGFGSSLSTTFTVPSNVTLTTLRISCIAHQDVTGTYKVMLNEGSTPEPWAPPGKKPTSIDVVTAGKNFVEMLNESRTDHGFTVIFDGESFNIDEATATDGNSTSLAKDFILSPGIYTIKYFFDESVNANIRIMEPLNNWRIVANVNNDLTWQTFEINEEHLLLRITVGGSTGELIKVVNGRVQLELGSEATEYEPPTVTTTTVDLQGNELRSLPDGTKDVLTIGADGSLKSSGNTITRVFNGVDNVIKNIENDNNQLYDVSMQDAIPHRDSTISNYIMCDTLPIITANDAWKGRAQGVAINGSGMPVFHIDGITTIEQANEWFAQHPTTIVYALAEPKPTDLGTIDLPKLPAPNATVYAVHDVAPDVSMDYSRDINIAFNNLEDVLNTLLGGA